MDGRDPRRHKGAAPHYLIRSDLPLPYPTERTCDDIREVLAFPGCKRAEPLYYMYRDLSRSEADRRWLKVRDLRYDITVIPPADLCGEYVKTKGHYHPANHSGTGYPEIYEVLAGKAHYLIQTRDCSDVVLIFARAGDIVIIPPGYGHVTINPDTEMTLQMANIVSSQFESDYRPYEALHGAAFYELSTGECIRNPACRRHPDFKRAEAWQLQTGDLPIRSPLYEHVVRRDFRLELLNCPENYPDAFAFTG